MKLTKQMTKKVMNLLFVTVIINLLSVTAIGQTTGMIVVPAGSPGAQAILDPNGDGYISATLAGFLTNDVLNSEIPYTTLVPAGNEPFGDILNGPNCGFSDFVESFLGGQDPVLSYLDASNNWLFRMRMANIAPNSKSYSILIDVDNLFGPSDPTYTPANPGFEIEIVLATNFGVTIYNIDGGCPGCEVAYGDDHYQKSIAGSAICNPYNYFLDFYVDFNDLMTAPCFAPFGITPSTAMRYVLVDNMAADKSTICNPNSASDVGGVGECPNLEVCFTDIIIGQPGCAPNNLGSCPPLSDCPTMASISAGATSISGTSSEAELTDIVIYLNGVAIPETGQVDAIGNWTVTLTVTVISNGDIVAASAQAPGESESNSDCNEQLIVSCPGPIEAAPAVTNATGKNFCGTGIIGYDINIYAPTGIIETPNPLPAVSLYLPVDATGTWVWKCTGNLGACNAGSGVDCIAEGGYMVTQVGPSGCESLPTFTCVSVGGDYSPVTSPTPSIVGATVFAGATSVDVIVTFGTAPSPQSGYVYLFVDGAFYAISPIINSAGTISISCPALPSCAAVTAMFVQSAAAGAHDCFSSPSASVIISGITDAPVIDGVLCSSVALTSVSGTSSEPDGTIIEVFQNGVSSGTTLVSGGAWTMAGSFGPSTTITATALNGADCETVSPLSASEFITLQSVATVSITPISILEGTTSVSGTAAPFTPGDIIILYIDGYPVFQDFLETMPATGLVDGSGNWTISTIYTNALYAGGTLTASVTAGSGCPSVQDDPTPITCIPPVISLTVNPDNATVCSGSFVANVEVLLSENGVIYQLYDNTLAANSGSSVLGTGGIINLTSATLTSNTILSVIAIKFPFGLCSATLTETVTVIVNAVPNLSLTVTAPTPICEGGSTNVSVELSELGFSYQLVDDGTSTPIGSPVAGTGGTINLPTGALSSTTTFNVVATGVVPSSCSGELSITVTVTLSGTAPDAGTNGTLTVCQATIPTDAELFAQLGGTPEVGGAWSNVGLVYTYTVAGAAPCADGTSTVTVTEQTAPDAGTNGTLTVCQATIPTDAELFAQLGGTPEVGGAWSNVGLVYTYTVAGAAPCADGTSTVTVTEQTAPDAGTNGTLTVCQATIPTDAELFAQLGGTPEVGGAWSNVGLVYTYTVTATAPCTVDGTSTVTVTEQTAPDAGTNGTLTVCQATIPTDAELFAQLGGTPEVGGAWSNVGLVYTYTVAGAAPCADGTSTVTVTEQTAPDAGTNGTLTVCQATIPTDAELFAQLGGTPEVGGAWSNIGLVYTYTVTATAPCTVDGTSTVTVTEQTAPDAGTNGTLTVCQATIPTDAELFAQLGGTPEVGGAWSNVGLVYTYTVTATAPCTVDGTSTVTVTEQTAPDAGTNGTLTVCQATIPTDAELFAQLGGTPEVGGAWSNVGLVYTYTVAGAAPCADGTSTVTVTEQTAPDAGTNGTLTVCQATIPTDAELFAQLGGTPEVGGAWSNVGLVYTYTVTATAPCTVDGTSTVTVTEQTAPDAGTNGTLTVCQATIPTDAELFAQLGGTPEVGGAWSNVGLVYTYTVTATAPCTVDGTSTVTVTEQTAPDAGTNGTLTVCQATIPTDAELFAQLGGTPEVGGAWSNVGLVYTYTVTATAPCTVDGTSTVTVTEQTAPDAGTNGTLTVCQATIPTDAELFAQLGGTPEVGGAWSNVGLVYTYTVTATAPCTVDGTSTVTVTEQTAPDAGTNGTLTVCQATIPTDAELFAQLGGTPEVGGAWSNVGLVYTYTVTATAPCTVDGTSTVTVTEQTAPDAGTNGTLTVCQATIPTDAELFAQLGGTPEVGGAWSNVGLVYTYTVTATAPCTVDGTSTVTVTEQTAPDAGTNGTLTVCQATIPTDAELFAQLGGTPEVGGAWSNVGLVYTYTVTATAPCTVDGTSTVTVTEQTAPDAGTNGTLTVCQATIPTDAELFAQLGGTPEVGGAWSNVGLVYTYTVTATAPCTVDGTSTVTVTEQTAPDAGTNGTLTVCQATIPTDAELFAQLGGTPEVGGAWSNVGLVYTYTVTATAPCTVDGTSTVTVTEQTAPDAGTNGTLTVCQATIPTDAELFAQLGGTPEVGGAWSNVGLVYTYTVTATAPCTVDGTSTVTVTEQTAPDAGTNGTLTVCQATIPTDAELFAQLGGTPEVGGAWSNVGLVYTYTVTATAPCTVDGTSTVTVTEQTAPDAGTNGTLTVCQATIPTDAELFAQLGGTPEVGGAWSNVGLVYTYTVTATAPCTVDGTSTVTVTEQAPLLNAVIDSMCIGDTYVFGTQSITTAGVYVETFTASNSCDSTVTLTLTINTTDTDGDGLTDCEETTGVDDPSTPEDPTTYGAGPFDPNDPCDPIGINTTDTDGDGLTDCEETTGVDDPSTPEDPTTYGAGPFDPNDPCDPIGINTTDTDGDGLTDCEETTGVDDPSTPEDPTTYGAGPFDPNDPCDPIGINTTDTDGDGLTDCEETTGVDDPSTPEDPTTYGAGPFDPNDPCDPIGINTTDTDGDGLTDCEETTGVDDPSTPEDPTTYGAGPFDPNDPCDPIGINTTDTDGDGLTDCEETTGVDDPSTPEDPTTYGAGPFDPNDPCDPIGINTTDTDGDGLTDCEETTGVDDPSTPEDPTTYGAGPFDPNDPCDPIGINTTDTDGDGLTDCEETTGVDDPSTPEDPTTYGAGPFDPNNPCDPIGIKQPIRRDGY